MYTIPEKEEVEKLLLSSESSFDDEDADNENYNNINSNRQSRHFTSRVIKTTWSILNVLLVGINLELILFRNAMDKKIPETLLQLQNDTLSIPVQENSTGFVRYDKMFGHVHMAKTAGSEINGELAAHYERVCGHKGYVPHTHTHI